MKLRNIALVVAAAVVLATTIQSVQAAFTGNLADLADNGGLLNIGDKTFSGFSYTATGLTGFDANNIIVTASVDANGVYYLTFGNSIALVGTAGDTADLKLNYTVTATAGTIGKIDQLYTGSARYGTLAIDETATSAGAPTAHSHLGPVDVSDPNVYPNGTFDIGEGDLLSINPSQVSLQVTKDIALAIFGGTSADPGFITISQVQQSFHQVPEASTLLAGALLLLPLGASSLRILRRNRMA